MKNWIFENFTTIIAIYGALVSTGLLAVRYVELRSKRRLIRVSMDLQLSNYIIGPESYLDGRQKDQYLEFVATNMSAQVNTIVDFQFICFNKVLWWEINGQRTDLRESNSEEWKYRQTSLAPTESVAISFMLNLDSREFYKSKGSNFDRLSKLSKMLTFCKVVCIDSSGRKYHSEDRNLKDLLKQFLEIEEKYTTEAYMDSYYPVPKNE